MMMNTIIVIIVIIGTKFCRSLSQDLGSTVLNKYKTAVIYLSQDYLDPPISQKKKKDSFFFFLQVSSIFEVL